MIVFFIAIILLAVGFGMNIWYQRKTGRSAAGCKCGCCGDRCGPVIHDDDPDTDE